MVVVGSGNVAQARAFAEERKLPFPLTTDPSLTTYTAAGMRRGATLVGRKTLRTAAEATRHGHFQSSTAGDPWQQGGAHLILPGGKVAWSSVSEVAGDHFTPADAIAALNAARPG